MDTGWCLQNPVGKKFTILFFYFFVLIQKSNKKATNECNDFLRVFMRTLRLVQGQHNRSAHPSWPAHLYV